MKNHFLSRFDAENLRKTIIYFVIGLSLIIIPLALGINKNDFVGFMFIFGFFFFFYAVLHLWENAKYYGIMCIIFIILIILICLVLENVLFVKTQLVKNYGEAFAWSFFICLAGVIAGIIGILLFRKQD